ncbi:MAG: hypothetical protein GXZ03_08510 [Proteiniphilum sp.]|nr:hypothetical protein [Proteiniphilum sp.]
MNVIQKRLVNSYTTLVMAEVMTIEEVPEVRLIGSIEYPIRSEVEIEIARRTIEILG